MTVLTNCFYLFISFFKIGLTGFGGGYAMMSMMMIECEKYSISTAQFADLNALDMIVPGPIAINAATYVGYLHSGFWGALAATIGVMLPSFFIVTLVLYFIWKYRENMIMTGAISGIKPAAVGLIAAAALIIASDVLTKPGADIAGIFSDPIGTVSFFMIGLFLATAIANLRFKVNPILLTVLAGILGAVLSGVSGGRLT